MGDGEGLGFSERGGGDGSRSVTGEAQVGFSVAFLGCVSRYIAFRG